MKIKTVIFSSVYLVLILVLCARCSVKSQLEAEVKTLDSLTIVLNTKLQEINATDTALLNRAISKFIIYATFIENNLNDTIVKADANNLQQFYVSGNNLKAYQVNKNSLKSRASLVLEQIKKLTADVSNGAITKEEFLKNYDTELKAATQLINLSDKEITRHTTNIQDFKNAILPVENLIKQKNNGQLPSAIKDSVNL